MNTKIRKSIITTGGLGTRLLPLTKESPKEMLPLYSVCNNNICLKPVVHIIFETLYRFGFREFGFIVGRGKRTVEDYFTPDKQFINFLREKKIYDQAKELDKFYDMIFNSQIIFINQPEPKGFGDAVLKAKPYIGTEPFLLHAGDDVILSNKSFHIKRLVNAFKELSSDVIFFVEEVREPKEYGVIKATQIGENIYEVLDIIEKPQHPPSNLAVIAIYIFQPVIFDALMSIKPDSKGEIQLTDAIRQVIIEGRKVHALKLDIDEKRLDVGNPYSYWNAFVESYEWTLNKMRGIHIGK